MKLAITVLLLSLSFKSHAQWGYKDENIASRFKPGILWYNTGWRPASDDKSRKYDRLILDITYSMPSGKPIHQTTKGSFGWNLNMMWDIPLTPGNTISIGTGINYKNARVGLEDFIEQDSVYKATKIIDTINTNVSKQVLGSHAFTIPLELRFRAPKWKHMKVHLGGYFGYQPSMYNKIWDKQTETTINRRNLLDTNPLVYGLHARLGFRNWALFADYRISKSFETGRSTDFNYLSFGLSISAF